MIRFIKNMFRRKFIGRLVIEPDKTPVRVMWGMRDIVVNPGERLVIYGDGNSVSCIEMTEDTP